MQGQMMRGLNIHMRGQSRSAQVCGMDCVQTASQAQGHAFACAAVQIVRYRPAVWCRAAEAEQGRLPSSPAEQAFGAVCRSRRCWTRPTLTRMSMSKRAGWTSSSTNGRSWTSWSAGRSSRTARSCARCAASLVPGSSDLESLIALCAPLMSSLCTPGSGQDLRGGLAHTRRCWAAHKERGAVIPAAQQPQPAGQPGAIRQGQGQHLWPQARQQDRGHPCRGCHHRRSIWRSWSWWPEHQSGPGMT